MTERIQKLKDQCWVEKRWDNDMWIEKHIDQEKFAQLIVQECLRQVEEQYKPILEDEAMMKDIRWAYYVDCGVDSYVAIREHFFGVEE